MPFRRLNVGGIDILVVVRDGSIAHRAWKQLARPARALRSATAEPVSGSNGGSHAAPAVAKEATLRKRVADIDWYHTIDLGDGLVTPGAFNHAPYLHHYQLPERLDGLRVLDVATFDGFWAFEFERRGAAEVVAVDVDRLGDVDLAPTVRRALSREELDKRLGQGFELACEVLGSKVRRECVSVYDLSPERLGTFDMVFVGSLLLHLTNPIRALQRIASVTAGHALIVECYHPMTPEAFAHYEGGAGENVWWFLSVDCLERMIRDAGFARVERFGTFGLMERGDSKPRWHAGFRAHP